MKVLSEMCHRHPTCRGDERPGWDAAKSPKGPTAKGDKYKSRLSFNNLGARRGVSPVQRAAVWRVEKVQYLP